MKLLFVLVSLFAAAHAQFSIGAPTSGATVQAGQNVTVQIIEPIDTSVEAGEEEVSLVIGIVGCGSSACPSPSANLGHILFVGIYQSQGVIGNTLNTFENFSFIVPSEISGKASIQVQHGFLTTLPGFVSIPGVEYASLAIQVGSAPSAYKIHPSADSTKCVGILGGVYADGTAVDIYDCNGSGTQTWQWNANALTSVNPADGSQWCLDAGVESSWTDGLQMKIWQCYSNLPQQTWTPDTSSGTIQLTSANFCLDLTNGDTTNQNILQIWTCVGNNNQVWTVTSA